MKVRFFILFLALFSLAASLPELPTVTVSWDYPEVNEDLVFNVYRSDNLTNWYRYATLPARCRGIILISNQPAEFFRISASNTVSKLESIF